MGYDLHITRRKSWTDKGDDISFAEFVQLVRRDTEFRYPGENGEDCADWRSPKSGYESWLCWSDGDIYTKNPDPEFIDKMVAVSRMLNAVVQGDDGEVYLSATEIQTESPPPRRLRQLCRRLPHFSNGRFGSSLSQRFCSVRCCWC